MTPAWQWGVPAFALSMLLLLGLTGDNVALFQWLNQLLAQAGDSGWSHITVLGDTSLALMLILPLLGRRPDISWQFVWAALAATVFSHGLKAIFSSLRPPAVLSEGSFHLIGPMLEHNSFPSGHTTTIFVLAGLLCLQRIDHRIKFAMLTLAGLVGLSRIACGVHWPLDVLGGMLVGWLSALLGVRLAMRYLAAGLNLWLQRGLALLLTTAALWSIFYYDNAYPGTRWFQVGLTLICLLISVKYQYRLFKIG